jgi:hypothetical protein
MFALNAEYAAFDRRRIMRRQYTKAFGGMAIIVLLGGGFNFVPFAEAQIAAGLLVTPLLCFAMLEAIAWRRLVRQLDRLRVQIRARPESRKKVITTDRCRAAGAGIRS